MTWRSVRSAEFEPPLPLQKREAITRMGFGLLNKVSEALKTPRLNARTILSRMTHAAGTLASLRQGAPVALAASRHAGLWLPLYCWRRWRWSSRVCSGTKTWTSSASRREANTQQLRERISLFLRRAISAAPDSTPMFETEFRG